MFKAVVKRILFKRRANRIARIILPYVNENEKVLDFGCGTLTVAEEILKRKRVQIRGVDVINFNLTDLPLSIYDGKRTDFEDKTFDVTYAAFVLHHCDNIEAVFTELLRLTRKKIILIEDTYKTRLGLFWIKLCDYVENRIGSLTINIPLNFRSEEEWLDFFHASDITTVHSQVLNPKSIRRHILFVLSLT